MRSNAGSLYTSLIETLSSQMRAENGQLYEKDSIDKLLDRLLRIIPEHSFVILLDLRGKELSSPQFSQKLEALMVQGVSHLTFVIGGPFGYTDELRKRADFRWSFSPLTFTHQMIRILLLEQVYRAFKIMRNEKYHH